MRKKKSRTNFAPDKIGTRNLTVRSSKLLSMPDISQSELTEVLRIQGREDNLKTVNVKKM